MWSAESYQGQCRHTSRVGSSSGTTELSPSIWRDSKQRLDLACLEEKGDEEHIPIAFFVAFPTILLQKRVLRIPQDPTSSED